MSRRMLSDHACEAAGHCVAALNGLSHEEGCSVLISILGATLNTRAGDDEGRMMLAEAVRSDLLQVMRDGAAGILTEGTVQ